MGSPPADALVRRLGVADAVVLGLASMIGAGVFSALAPAARAAGDGLLVGLVLAAVVAYCNATSSAQLAAQYPTSGGTYVYGRERLGEWPGFLAGWGFVIGKTASCAAMALTFAAYVAPGAAQRPVAALTAVVLMAVTSRGITRTAGLARVVVAVTLLSLAVVVAACLAGGQAQGSRLEADDVLTGSAYGVLQAAGLMFFAFAGYARIATLGEEVREPRRTIPRAVVVSLGLCFAVYALVATSVLSVLGADGVGASAAPLAAAVEAGSWSAVSPAVRVGAAAASLGALLALAAGVGRTMLAMARTGDLPDWLAGVHPVHRVPHHAQLALAAAVVVLVLVADLRDAIGFSSFGVLLYYLVANIAAFTQRGDDRRYPRALQVLGAAGCVVLVVTLPLSSVGGGLAVYAAGIGYRWWRLRSRRR